MPRKILLACVLSLLLLPQGVFGQNTLLTGVVRTETQAPVAGAVVRIPSMDLETVTNDFGQYRFTIAPENVPALR